MTDKGIKEVLTNLENVESLETLDISGNLIGQSPFFSGAAEAICSFLEKQSTLVELHMGHNMLRGQQA